MDNLDVTLNLLDDLYKPFQKLYSETNYIHRESNYPLSFIKQLLLSFESRLSKLSSDENIFIQAASIYQEALKRNGYNHKLSYNNSDKYNSNNNNDEDNYNNNATKNDNNYNNNKFNFNLNKNCVNSDNNNNKNDFNSYENKDSNDNNGKAKFNSNDNRGNNSNNINYNSNGNDNVKNSNINDATNNNPRTSKQRKRNMI